MQIDPDILAECLRAVDRPANGVKSGPTADEILTARVATRPERAAYRSAILDVTRSQMSDERAERYASREHVCNYCTASFGDKQGRTRHEGRMHPELVERDVVAAWMEDPNIRRVAARVQLSGPSIYLILDRAGVKRRRTRWQQHPHEAGA
jgi:hypothetical protein